MKKKKAIKKLLVKIEMQNRKILMDIEFIRQNIPVSIPFVTTTTSNYPLADFYRAIPDTNTDVIS